MDTLITQKCKYEKKKEENENLLYFCYKQESCWHFGVFTASLFALHISILKYLFLYNLYL